jgi:nicotinamidase-related amidase
MSDRAARHLRHRSRNGGLALLVVDMLNRYEHPEADRLADGVAGALPGVRTLLDRAGELEVPVIYVNDNYGDWNSSVEELTQKALDGDHPELVEPVLPPSGASFVVKARHNAFYGTPLEYLLDQMGIEHLVFAGQVTEQCIFYSVIDAYVRHFDATIVTDAVASIYPDLGDAALKMMKRNLGAKLISADHCAFESDDR